MNYKMEHNDHLFKMFYINDNTTNIKITYTKITSLSNCIIKIVFKNINILV